MISFENLSFARAGRTLVRDASLQIHPRARVGLVGRNGCGKSSLLALLRGDLEPEAGHYGRPESWLIASAAQETPGLACSALDYVLDGHQAFRAAEKLMATAQTGEEIAAAHDAYGAVFGYEQEARARRLLHGLGFSLEQQGQPVASFSGGWRMRLNLAQALIAPADLLLLDEPSNHLDLDAVIWLQDYLKTLPCTQIIIAHDRELLDSLCTQILHLENETLTLYSGNYSSFERQRAERRRQSEALYQQEQQRRAHLEDFVRRFRASATKAKQAQSRIKALEKLSALPPPPEGEAYRLQWPEPEALPDPLFHCRGVAIGPGTTPLLQGLRLRLTPSTRLGLLGRHGAGKSTLLRFLAQQLPALAGESHWHPQCRLGYFTQHQLDSLDGGRDALEHWQALRPTAPAQEGRNFLGGFGFRGDGLATPVAHYSGGERARLALALLVARAPNLLLLDEPTNHLDLTLRDALTEALQNYSGGLVLVSHDRSLLRACCDEFLLVANGQVQPFDGDLDDYQQLLLTEERAASAPPAEALPPSARVQNRREAADRRARLRPLQQALAAAEREMNRLNERASALQIQLADEALYADREALRRVMAEDASVQKELAAAETRWLQRAEELEAAERE